MSQLKPKRIILHCGLHKTGSTYIQRNLQTNRELLLEKEVLYIGPNTFQKRCSALWHYLQWGRLNHKTPERLESETKSTLMELAGMHPETIHTIFLSFEAIFGTLRSGLVEPTSQKAPNHEEKTGLYRYAKSRTNRLISGLEASLDHRSIAWTILITIRSHEAFVRSCHTQLLKEGHHKPQISIRLKKQPISLEQDLNIWRSPYKNFAATVTSLLSGSIMNKPLTPTSTAPFFGMY